MVSMFTRKNDEQEHLGSRTKSLVLIVDDDKIIRRIHKMLLTKFGFESHAVENGKEAVDL